MINKNNQHMATFQTANNNRFQCKSGGGSKFGATASSMANSVSSGLSKGYPMYDTTSTCNTASRPSNLGAAKIRGGGKPYSSFNNLRSSAYGYTSQGAAMAKTFRGSYAAPSEIRRAQCGGRRKTKRRKRGGIQVGITGKVKASPGMDCNKSIVGSECIKGFICQPPSKTAGKYGTCQSGKSVAGKWGLGGRKSRRKKSRRRKSRRRKSRRKKSRRKKSRRKKSRRKKSRKRKSTHRKGQRGGNKWSQAGSNQALGYRYSSPNFNEPMPWVLGGPGSKVVTPLTR